MTPAEAMERAEFLAQRSNPHPNPRVGAVLITPEGEPVGEGHHVEPGLPHAEVLALAAAGERARGATLVVTLEPCNHQGRTPPCTEAVLAAGLSRVLVGAVDPDQRVRGSGIERLRAGGIEVEVIDPPLISVDPAYFHYRRTGRPFVTLKLAATLDGQTAAADGSSRWITGEAARENAHRLRAEADGVVIGSATMRMDDPRLDVRLKGYSGRQPRPIVLAGSQPLPETGHLWDRDPLVIRPAGGGSVDLASALREIGEAGMLSVLVEGGPTLAGAFLAADLVDRGVLYLAGKLAGGVGRPLFDRSWPSLDSAREISIVNVAQLGPDLRIEFELK